MPKASSRHAGAIPVTILAATVHGLIALLTNSSRFFFGAFGPGSVIVMLSIFFEDSSLALRGDVPYRDFTVEYPILALLVFMIPRLFVSDFAGYRVAFGVELPLFNAAAVFTVARHVARNEGVERVPSRLAWYTAFFTCLCPLSMGPYDLAPMAVAFAAADMWFAGRNALGGTLAGIGVLLKIFPGAVAAPALVWEATRIRDSRGRGVSAFLATIAVGMSFWLWLAGRSIAGFFRYHGERGLEIGSLYAGILMLVGKARGENVPWAFDHMATHIAPEWGERLAPLTLPIQLASVLLFMWRFHGSGMKEGVRYAGAAVLAFMATGKFLSPQYLIWLIPFVTVIGGDTGRRARWIYLSACLATTLIYPLIALKLIIDDHDLLAIILLNYRNAMLVGLLFLLLFGRETSAARPVLETLDSPAMEGIRRGSSDGITYDRTP